MLVPLLSVLNESELYSTWLPNWTVPRLRISRSNKLSQHGRCSQLVLVTVDLPWPFSAREVVLDASGVDDIDYTGDIAVLVRTLEPGDTSTVGRSGGVCMCTRLRERRYLVSFDVFNSFFLYFLHRRRPRD